MPRGDDEAKGGEAYYDGDSYSGDGEAKGGWAAAPAPAAGEEPRDPARDAAATTIQGLSRRLRSNDAVLDLCRKVFEVGYDAESGDYFYYNKRNGQSYWEAPAILKGHEPYPTDARASRAQARISAAFRGRLARRTVAALLPTVYRRDYDPASGDMYYTDSRTGAARWDNPATAQGAHIGRELALSGAPDFEIGAESKLILDRDAEIVRLKAALEAKESDVDAAKRGTHRDLDRELRLRRMAEALKGQKRAKNLDAWRNEHVVAWFMELELDAYVPALVESRVDGLLLLNMDEDDFRELGVVKRLHQRKLDVALRKYKVRYERQQHGGDSSLDVGDDDDDVDEDDSDSPSSESSRSSAPAQEVGGDVDEDDLLPTEEELLELNLDRANVQIEVIFPGDEETYPRVGDVVRCHYICTLAGKPDVHVENTRRRRTPFEFVLGIGQVIRGWERGVLQMSFGERSRVTVSAAYAYGAEGRLPLIPPNADLVFDMELIRWRPRKVWTKPLLQQPGLSERPYEDDDDPGDVEESLDSDNEYDDG